MRLKCVCGNPLKYVKDDSGCGDLRCLSCGKTSGYCANTHDAIMAFKRIYDHSPIEEVKGMNELTREQMNHDPYFRLKAELMHSSNYVPRPYQTVGGMWTVDTYKKDGITLQIMDEGYSARIFTEVDKLDVHETNAGHTCQLEFKAGNMDMIKGILAVMGL